MFYIYIAECKNNQGTRKRLYVGSTKNLRTRLKQHRSGSTKTTKSFSAIKLIYYEACLDKTDARKREIQLKTGFGRGYLNRRLEGYLTRGIS